MPPTHLARPPLDFGKPALAKHGEKVGVEAKSFEQSFLADAARIRLLFRVRLLARVGSVAPVVDHDAVIVDQFVVQPVLAVQAVHVAESGGGTLDRRLVVAVAEDLLNRLGVLFRELGGKLCVDRAKLDISSSCSSLDREAREHDEATKTHPTFLDRLDFRQLEDPLRLEVLLLPFRLQGLVSLELLLGDFVFTLPRNVEHTPQPVGGLFEEIVVVGSAAAPAAGSERISSLEELARPSCRGVIGEEGRSLDVVGSVRRSHRGSFAAEIVRTGPEQIGRKDFALFGAT